MLLRFAPLTSIDQTELALALLELYAFAADEALFTDIPIAFETILEDAQADPAKYNLDEERDLLREEPVAARQLLVETMMGRVFELLDARVAKFGRNYAFERVPGSHFSIRCKPVEDINAAAYATAWLSFFNVIDATETLNMTKKEKRALRMRYARVFELVALLACSTIGPAVGWWTGRSWTEAAKIENFQKLCDVVGNGMVKPTEHWQEIQKQAKDAGADGFLVTTIAGSITSASIWIVLGATVQRTHRQKKKVGVNERRRLLNFYTNRPTIAMIGAAADPYPHEDVLAQDYADADCLYLHGEMLWDLLSLYDPLKQVGPKTHLVAEIENELKVEMNSVLNGVKIDVHGVSYKLVNAFADYAPTA